MTGVSLSRWTMSYFAAALVSLISAECLMTVGFGYPAAPLAAGDTLALVHIVAIGWLSLLMCGALFQFVPVLVARPLYSNELPLPALICLVTGLAALVLGFLNMGGAVTPDAVLFSLAAALLGVGFGVVSWNLGRTLWASRPLPLFPRFVAVGIFSLSATVALGVIFALVLGGVATSEPLLDVTASGLPIHAIAGLGGWLTLTALGVSYRLLAMFMLAPEPGGASARGAFYFGTAALGVAILGGVAAICIDDALLMTALSVAGLLGLCALILYGGDVVHLYRARQRRVIETNSRMAICALASLAAAVVLIIGLVGADRLAGNAAAIVFLVAFGWLSGLGLAQLYKIVAFLTWLECYGPILGKKATPRVQDLVVEGRAQKWFTLYFVAVWGAAASLLLDQPLPFRLGAGLMVVATAGIVVELVRTRRLMDVKVALRLPNMVAAPRLLRSTAQRA